MDTINTRLKVKTDTTANWALVSGTFTPLKGEIIVYSDYQTVGEGASQVVIPGIKIGTGNAYVGDLPFVDQDTRATLLAHISNSGIHVTGRQKTFWSNKIDIDESSGQEVQNETLIFTRDDWRV